jgi:predicted site-specific integrase-resolvase
METEKFDIQGAADFLEVPKSTVKYWMMQGTGPVFTKLGKRIKFQKSDLIEFKESKRMCQSVRRKAA